MTNRLLVCCRMANHAQSVSSSSPIGRSKVCPSRVKASSISLVKCTKQRSSLARMDQSAFTAGNISFQCKINPLISACHSLKHSTCHTQVGSNISFYFIPNSITHHAPKNKNTRNVSQQPSQPFDTALYHS